LKIKERRSWRTWHLVVVGVVAALVGMVIGNSGGGTASSQPNTPTYTLPVPSGSSTQTTTGTIPTSTTVASSPTTSSAPAGSPSTTVATTSPAAPDVVQVLLGPTPVTQGSWTSTPFTVGSGQWSIGWAYQCTPAPASGPAFQVFVVPAGGSPGPSSAVTETAASGNSVTTLDSVGSQELRVQAPASCVWKVKVTGVG